MTPQLGDIVLYRWTAQELRLWRPVNADFPEQSPAIVTHLWPNNVVNLTVFADTTGGVSRLTKILEGTMPGQWSARA